mgnify:FL=1
MRLISSPQRQALRELNILNDRATLNKTQADTRKINRENMIAIQSEVETAADTIFAEASEASKVFFTQLRNLDKKIRSESNNSEAQKNLMENRQKIVKEISNFQNSVATRIANSANMLNQIGASTSVLDTKLENFNANFNYLRNIKDGNLVTVKERIELDKEQIKKQNEEIAKYEGQAIVAGFNPKTRKGQTYIRNLQLVNRRVLDNYGDGNPALDYIKKDREGLVAIMNSTMPQIVAEMEKLYRTGLKTGIARSFLQRPMQLAQELFGDAEGSQITKNLEELAGGKVADFEVFKAMSSRTTLELMEYVKGNLNQKEVQLLRDASPKETGTPQANIRQIASLIAINERKKAQHEAYINFLLKIGNRDIPREEKDQMVRDYVNSTLNAALGETARKKFIKRVDEVTKNILKDYNAANEKKTDNESGKKLNITSRPMGS